MKHHILAKYKAEITPEQKAEYAPKILELFNETLEIPGITGVEVKTNCIPRENRYDLMIVLTMDPSSLPAYDSCAAHKKWKEDYGPCLEKKAIFDCEE